MLNVRVASADLLFERSKVLEIIDIAMDLIALLPDSEIVTIPTAHAKSRAKLFHGKSLFSDFDFTEFENLAKTEVTDTITDPQRAGTHWVVI